MPDSLLLHTITLASCIIATRCLSCLCFHLILLYPRTRLVIAFNDHHYTDVLINKAGIVQLEKTETNKPDNMDPQTNATSLAAPVAQQDRIIIIDSLRGIALLGILLMNIPYFGLPEPSFDNLTINHELGTINQKVWYIINWFLEGSQRAIFSMLFGAGTILFVTRLEKRLQGMMPAEYFIRRQLWLLIFGLVNAFVLLWPGDILFQYAISGIIVFVFRRTPVKGLLIAAGICLLLMAGIFYTCLLIPFHQTPIRYDQYTSVLCQNIFQELLRRNISCCCALW